jgi:NAD(P)-dependent dehydrogenase (short-subunit alcohol dehydrogenase family)
MPATHPQRVLITAGGSGIGHAMASAFAAEGSQVWVTDVDAAALARCPDTWKRSEVDSADEPAVAALFGEIEKDWGGLDALCANAGIAGPTAAVEDIDLADWRRCVSVNLEGAFLASKYAAPMLKRQRAGAIVITSSVAGIMANPFRAPYVAAKWAVIGLMKTLAMELGPFNVRANAICPGPVNGDRMDRVLAKEAESKGTTAEALRAGYASGTSMGSFVEAGDIADMAVFLASPRARMVSGQIIAVDGNTTNPDPQV